MGKYWPLSSFLVMVAISIVSPAFAEERETNAAAAGVAAGAGGSAGAGVAAKVYANKVEKKSAQSARQLAHEMEKAYPLVHSDMIRPSVLRQAPPLLRNPNWAAVDRKTADQVHAAAKNSNSFLSRSSAEEMAMEISRSPANGIALEIEHLSGVDEYRNAYLGGFNVDIKTAKTPFRGTPAQAAEFIRRQAAESKTILSVRMAEVFHNPGSEARNATNRMRNRDIEVRNQGRRLEQERHQSRVARARVRGNRGLIGGVGGAALLGAGLYFGDEMFSDSCDVASSRTCQRLLERKQDGMRQDSPDQAVRGADR